MLQFSDTPSVGADAQDLNNIQYVQDVEGYTFNAIPSYDPEFAKLHKALTEQYPHELFNIDGIGDQLDIHRSSQDFFRKNSGPTTDISTDANSNVSGKDVITYNYEVPKPLMRLNSYYNLWYKLRKHYGLERANEVIAAQVRGDIYINDAWDIGRPYCFNYSMYDIALEGLKMGSRLEISPAKGFSQFLRQVEQFTVYAANSTLGATGLADILIVGGWFVDRMFETGKDHKYLACRDINNKEQAKQEIRDYCYEQITSLLYTLNWEFRGHQCVTEDTEVLTPDGFKTLDTLQVGNSIYTWKDGILNTNTVDAVNIYEHKGNMHGYYGDNLAQEVTTNHNVLYGNGGIGFQLAESETIFKRENISFPVAINNAREDYEVDDVVLKSLSELPSWVAQLSKRQARLLLDNWSTEIDNAELVDTLQHLCVLAGYSSYVTEHEITENGEEVIKYKLHKNNNINEKVTDRIKFYYEGRVWCPTTKDGIVIFRKNGRIFISGNSPFTNISIYDEHFLNELAPTYLINGIAPSIESIQFLQEIFFDAYNDTLRRTPLTFPVPTACFSTEKDEDGVPHIRDEKFIDFVAKNNLEFGVINHYNGDTATLSSCCRLRSDTSKLGYANTFGAGSTKIGSIGVVTMNLYRYATSSDTVDEFLDTVAYYTKMCSDINHAKRMFIQNRIDRGALPLYSLGLMALDKQYSTAGIVGLYESIKELGYDITEPSGTDIANEVMNTINEVNERCDKLYGDGHIHYHHNFEQVPAESSSIKLADKDKILGYQQGEYSYYSNQFIPLIANADMLSRIDLQGEFDHKCTGGAICHININDTITDLTVMKSLIQYCAQQGVVYWAANYALGWCPKCKVMSVVQKCSEEEHHCVKCSTKIDVFTRVVGFLTNTKHWHVVRREKDWPNRIFYKNKRGCSKQIEQ